MMLTGSTEDAIRELSEWIDAYPPNATRSAEAQLWGRCAKVAEEAGELVSALVGMTNQNPRKGITHNIMDVRRELLDVALTALCAVEHTTENSGESLRMFRDHVERVKARMDASRVTAVEAEHFRKLQAHPYKGGPNHGDKCVRCGVTYVGTTAHAVHPPEMST